MYSKQVQFRNPTTWKPLTKSTRLQARTASRRPTLKPAEPAAVICQMERTLILARMHSKQVQSRLPTTARPLSTSGAGLMHVPTTVAGVSVLGHLSYSPVAYRLTEPPAGLRLDCQRRSCCCCSCYQQACCMPCELAVTRSCSA